MSKNSSRAKWNHQMKAYLIELLRDHDVPKYRTQNAWSKEAWTNIVAKFNQRFDVSFMVVQVKQNEQDLKRDFKTVKDLISESGFGWDRDRKMVVAPDNVWAALEARKNKDALFWRGKSFPYYEDLFALYDGRYAQGRSCHGMDYYANKATQLSQLPTSHSPQQQGLEAHLHTPTPTIHAPGDSSMQFDIEEDSENTNWFSSNNTFSQVEANPTQGNDLTLHAPSQVETVPISSQRVGQTLHEIPQVVHRNPRPASSAPEVTSTKRARKQKTTSIDDFHERYLKLRREEIDRYAAIEERKLRDPFSIKKCIKALERLEGLSMADMLKAADIFTANKENREVFLSFSSNELRLGWLTEKIRNT
uniref:Myb/SANT-like domain-containing protein n=1 Tax=Triticum urartu TaxID=4572 RepID=A0A8R7TFG8_TRIUA